MVKLRILKPVKIRIRHNPFKWDGSFLGSFDEKIILNETNYNGLRYVQLNIWTYQDYAILAGLSNIISANLVCIFDELKIAFGLLKTGTHSIKINNKIYVLYKAVHDQDFHFDETVSEETLSKYQHLKLLNLKIKYLLTYRHLMGVSPNSDSGIRIRKSGTGLIFPISINDKFTIDQKKGVINNGVKIISDKNYKKWFKQDESFSSVVQQMIGFNPSDDIVEKVSQVRKQLYDIVHRINKELVWLENLVCCSLLDHLEDTEN